MMASSESFSKYQNIMVLIYHISSYLASSYSDGEVLFHVLFNYFTYSVNFIRPLSIDLPILNIGLFIEVNILKSYLSQYHTPPNHHRVVHWSEHISLLLIISYPPLDHHRERQCISFLINIELGSLRFYVSLLHRGISP
jgi:hypothetical protein